MLPRKTLSSNNTNANSNESSIGYLILGTKPMKTSRNYTKMYNIPKQI